MNKKLFISQYSDQILESPKSETLNMFPPKENR